MTNNFISNETPIVGKLSIISMKGCEGITAKIDEYLRALRGYEDTETYVTHVTCPRFGTGEGKCVIDETVRGHDVYIICDVFNYGVTYKMYGVENHMSPDDHYQDLKRVIAAMGGKARLVTVVMLMLYEGRQHRRNGRVSLNKKDTIVISPDEGGMSRCMYYSSVLKLDLGMFYKRRDYSVIVNGKNPIEAHEYLGRDVNGKDVIIVDDMISSGESVIDVANNLKKQGAKRIFVFASFGLFCNGLECFDKAAADGIVDKIFTTNLIYRNPDLATREWYCEVDMSKYISLLIDTLNHDETISSLLNPVTKIKNLVSKLENK